MSSQHTEIGAINLQWSTQLIDTLVLNGITRFILSPGSRSTPLTLAVVRHPDAKHWVIIDERSAAFFALGQSKQCGNTTALICTSGSAVANWLPAVVEANHAAIPLLLLSADRPAELHSRGANQTIDQQQLFSSQVRGTHPLPPPDEQGNPVTAIQKLLQQVLIELNQPIPGPVHINIPFREPLLPDPPNDMEWAPEPIRLLPPRSLSRRWLRVGEAAEKVHQKPGVILCGEGVYSNHFPEQLLTLAEQLDCIILADPLSNLRWGAATSPHLLTHYDGTLRALTHSNHQPHWVIQFGDFPLSKAVANWLSKQPPAHYLNVQHRRHWSDPESLTTETFHCSPEQFIESVLKQIETPATLPDWNEPFTTLEQRATKWHSTYPMSEQRLLTTLHQLLPANSVLFSANSMMIRDIDGWMAWREAPLQLHANRGASGIDGNLSTLCGIRSQLDDNQPLIALLGDLTLFHDLNALSLLQQSNSSLILIVVNNGGGNIFSYLPPAQLPEFEAVWLTPPDIDFEKAAALYDLPYLRVEGAVDLEQLLTEQLHQHGPKLIEWVVDRTTSIADHHNYWESLQ